jgi:hypothetical protein
LEQWWFCIGSVVGIEDMNGQTSNPAAFISFLYRCDNQSGRLSTLHFPFVIKANFGNELSQIALQDARLRSLPPIWGGDTETIDPLSF